MAPGLEKEKKTQQLVVRPGYSRESGAGGPVVVGVAALGETEALGRPGTLALLLPHRPLWGMAQASPWLRVSPHLPGGNASALCFPAHLLHPSAVVAFLCRPAISYSAGGLALPVHVAPETCL